MARIVDIARIDHSSAEIQMKRSSGGLNQPSKNLTDIYPMNTIINEISCLKTKRNYFLQKIEIFI